MARPHALLVLLLSHQLRPFTEVFFPLSSGVTNPMGRLGGSGGVISARSASNTFLNCTPVLRLSVSWLIASASVACSSWLKRLASSPCAAASVRTRTKVRMISMFVVGGVIGGISGFIGALNDPCASGGSLLQGAAVGASIGAISAAVPIGGTIFAAAARNALAGGAGNAAGQLVGGGSVSGRQVVAQGTVGAISGAVGNLTAMSTGLGLVSMTSQGVGATAAIATGAALNLGMPTNAGGLLSSGAGNNCTCKK